MKTQTPYFAQVHDDDPHYAGMACVVTDERLTIIAEGYEGDFYEREEMPHHWPLAEADFVLDACHAALRAVAGSTRRAADGRESG